MDTMIALVKEKPERGLWMREVPIPTVGKNDVKIKIKKTAICGTDLHIYNWDEWSQHTIRTPMTIGHEYVGEIVEIGENVEGFELGERVTGVGLAMKIVDAFLNAEFEGGRHARRVALIGQIEEK